MVLAPFCPPVRPSAAIVSLSAVVPSECPFVDQWNRSPMGGNSWHYY